MKKKVLFVMHLPPPVHGAAMIGKYIKDSLLINEAFDCLYINPTMAKDINDLAKISFKKLFSMLLLLLKIRNTIHNEKPEICYYTPASGRKGFYKSYIIVLWLKLHKQKIVLHFHNKGISKRANESVDSFLFKTFFKNVKLVLLSEYLYPEFKNYIDIKDVVYCPNGIPSTKNLNPSLIKLENKFINILFLSNMLEGKGVWTLLEALKILKESGVYFTCNFIGSWSQITEVEFNNKVNEFGLESYVVGHGPKYGIDKNKFFELADIFVFPTHYENETFGLVLLEAMEFAIPCISTFEGGIPDVVSDKETGLLIEGKNPILLASNIKYLIDNKDIRYQMGQEGYQRFKKLFTIERFEQRFITILKNIY